MASQNVTELERKLQRFFATDNRFRFVKKLPSGATGNCVCFEERHPQTGNTRKIVLKYPGDDAETTLDAMKNEISWLRVLRHSNHIVKILTIQNGPNAGLRGLDSIFIILEFMENGSLGQFIDRSIDIELPNRILWSLFLCLVRACIAMAWPPQQQGQPEEPKPNVRPSSLAHWDMHGENLLLGRLGGISEHSLVPILKLIDFDNAAEVDKEIEPDPADKHAFDDELELERYRRRQGATSMGARANILDIGQIMARILCGDHSLDEGGCREFIEHEYPLLDEDLQLLIVRCLAADPLNRPNLDELLERTLNAALSRTYRNTPYHKYETDARVREIVQRCILNA
ncbi:kinase-like domain-containing protein [Nemania serpens]|nr:kinase-like domain-containing protein [Nemania serpens]